MDKTGQTQHMQHLKKGIKPRRNWTARFLEKLSECGIVGWACRDAGINRTTAYRRRDADPAFAVAWDDAVELAVATLEVEARRRAMERSDLLLIFLLKALRPEIYREAKGNITIVNDAAPIASPSVAKAALSAAKIEHDRQSSPQ